MMYSVYVSQKGDHVFTTETNSPLRIKKLLELFRKKFPTREGFETTVSVDRQESDNYDDPNEFLRKHFPGPFSSEVD